MTDYVLLCAMPLNLIADDARFNVFYIISFVFGLLGLAFDGLLSAVFGDLYPIIACQLLVTSGFSDLAVS